MCIYSKYPLSGSLANKTNILELIVDSFVFVTMFAIGIFTRILRCMDREEFFPSSLTVKYGKKYKCRQCHASFRFVREQLPEWETMTHEQRRKAVVANRTENKRGKARKLMAIHKALGRVQKYDTMSLKS